MKGKKFLITCGNAFLFYLLSAGAALAQGEVAAAAHNEYTVKAALAINIGFGLALAAFGGALGQGRAATAALEGIARNPGAANKVFTPMLLSLALIESLVIYAFVISLILQGKV
jgi:F-type H+-transporting ATPase subunit c